MHSFCEDIWNKDGYSLMIADVVHTPYEVKIAGSYVIIVRVFIESAGMVFEIEEDSGVYIGFNSSSKMKSFILPVKAAHKIYGDSSKLILLAILKMLKLNTARMKLFALSEKNVSTVSSI
ncbi:hypothetical protein Tco_1295505 [Tanacetum coccineum]